MWPNPVLTHSSDCTGSGRLHGFLSVISVFGKTVDHNGLRGVFLSLLPKTQRWASGQDLLRQPFFFFLNYDSTCCSPLQPVLGLLPLRHLCSAVVVVFLSWRADVFGPVVRRITLGERNRTRCVCKKKKKKTCEKCKLIGNYTLSIVAWPDRGLLSFFF